MAGVTMVQFRGVKATVEALQNIEVPNWALFNGKIMIEKCETDDLNESVSLFAAICNKLHSSNSTGTYTLKTYEDLDGKHIKPSTEPDRSFNFTLFEPGEFTPGFHSGGREDRLMQRLDAIEAKIAAQDDSEEGEEKIGSVVMDWVNKFLEMPEIRSRVATAMGSLLDKFLPMPNNNNNQGAISNPASIGSVPDEQKQIELINQAVQLLYSVDKNLGVHLMKVAEIAQKNPGKYNMLIGML